MGDLCCRWKRDSRNAGLGEEAGGWRYALSSKRRQALSAKLDRAKNIEQRQSLAAGI
jgi:hypothetical protein